MPRQPLHSERVRLRVPQPPGSRLALYFIRLLLWQLRNTLSRRHLRNVVLMQGGGGMVALQWVFLVLFGINFTWIALSGVQSLIGF